MIVVMVLCDGELSVLKEGNLSVSLNEWAAMWPNEIYFFAEITEV